LHGIRLHIATLQAETQHLRAAAQSFNELAPESVVLVDHCGLEVRKVEQPRLGLGIRIHVTVVVEMIARQVGEYRDVECHLRRRIRPGARQWPLAIIHRDRSRSNEPADPTHRARFHADAFLSAAHAVESSTF
jgi:hypothetical protein